MEERRQGFFKRLLDGLKNHTHFEAGEAGFDFDAVFSGETTQEGFEEIIRGWDPETQLVMSHLVEEASNRTLEERNKYVEKIGRPRALLAVGKDAAEIGQSYVKVNNIVITINSLSSENLTNFSEAFKKLGIEPPSELTGKK